MSKQPEALRLAEELPRHVEVIRVWLAADSINGVFNASAAELRRLHSVNADLLEALQRIAGRCDAEAAYKIARAAIARATGEA